MNIIPEGLREGPVCNCMKTKEHRKRKDAEGLRETPRPVLRWSFGIPLGKKECVSACF